MAKFVQSFLFDLPTLQSLEGVFHHVGDARLGEVHGLCLHVTEAPEFKSTGFALGNVVVGRVVWQLKPCGIGPAVLAAKRNFDPV